MSCGPFGIQRTKVQVVDKHEVIASWTYPMKVFHINFKIISSPKKFLDGNATHKHNLYTPLQRNGFNSPQQWKPIINKHHIFQKLLNV